MEHELFAPLAIVEESIEAFRERYAAAGIELDTAGLVGAGGWVRGDAGRLAQVFANLFENSLRYTHAGGRLCIAAGVEGKRLILQFDDTAPAPSPAALPRLFERFFRAEPSRSRELGGSGLGLAICKTLIEAHGGKVSGSVSLKTDYLISNEPSTSAKSVKAAKLGVPVITEEEFLEKFKTQEETL